MMTMEKYVYVILESKGNNWSTLGDYDYNHYNYHNRLIAIFDSYEGANNHISNWRRTMIKRGCVVSEAVYANESIMTVRLAEEPEDFKYDESMRDFDYKVDYIRKIEPWYLHIGDL